MRFLTIFDCAEVDWREEMLGRGQEGSERSYGVPNTLSESFTVIGSQEVTFVSFYRKSAGVLQDVLEFLQDVCNFLQDVQKWDFGELMEGKRWRNEYGGEIGV